MYVLGIALAVTVVDQLTKYAIHQAMVLHESIPVIPGFFHITYILNRGAAFGILENQQWLFLVMALALFLLYGLFRKKLPATPWVYGGAGLLLGGALGNALDEMCLTGAEIAAQGQDIAVAEDRPQGLAQSDRIRF